MPNSAILPPRSAELNAASIRANTPAGSPMPRLSRMAAHWTRFSFSGGPIRLSLRRKVKKLKLLEFTGGCRMSGQFTKVGLNGT
jgi:hypothetical protein